MVTKNQTKRKRDIKTKLMAAICMLLVSSIMMVSTTYAWFTLSTAPEVTGISTAVGANGNLEIALLPKNGDVKTITSAAGDSVLPIEQRNVTWGNIVDLSDGDVYGMDKINLYPAALNDKDATYDENGYLVGLSTGGLLLTPSYGNDGRVSGLLDNTSAGYYDATEGDFYPNESMGVRGVGTASGMTPRQLAYRNARAAAATAASQAKSTASSSLNNNGSTLANVAIKKATGTETYTLDDVNALLAIVDDLLGTDSKTGALQKIETAYKQYILAYVASAQVPNVEGENAVQLYQTIEADVENPNKTPQDVINTLNTAAAAADIDLSKVTMPAALTAAIEKLATTKSEVQSAKTTLENLKNSGATSYTWDQISGPLYKLCDTENMEINGIKASDIKEKMSDLVNSVASNGLKVTMQPGGGVYADIADHCGNYSAQVVIEEVSYNSLVLKNMTARMETAATATAYLTAIGTAVEGAGAPASDNSVAMPITDMYGYVIDLAFRTNAADSSLLLQRDAVDRIYGDNDNEGTMGHGSNMTFNGFAQELVLPEQSAQPGETGYNPNYDRYANIRNLMGAIRIVFFIPGEEQNTVVMNARLDAEKATLKDGTWTANLVLYRQQKVTTTSTVEGEPDTVTYNEVPVTDDVIMALTQNTAHQLSVLVYLDGNEITNADVAASVASSLSGQLNLQFASSATLIPMDYSTLHTPNTAGGTTGGTESGGTESGGTESGGTESGGEESGTN